MGVSLRVCLVADLSELVGWGGSVSWFIFH